MVNVVLNAEQIRLMEESQGEICLRTPEGRMLGLLHRGSMIRSADDEEAFFQRMKARNKALPSSEGRCTKDVLSSLPTMKG